MISLRTIPFFRIFLPFISGIMISLCWFRIQPVFFWTGMITGILGASFIYFIPKQDKATRRVFLLAADGFLFCFAAALVYSIDVRNSEAYYGKSLIEGTEKQYLGVLTELPVEKEKFWKCELRIKAVKGEREFKKADGKILLYIRKNEKPLRPLCGEQVLFNADLKEIEAPKNPFEFDYKNYLANKQIYHCAFIDEEDCRFLGKSAGNTIWNSGLKVKRYLLENLKSSGLNQEAFGICAALLTGYDEEIDRTVMDAFSHSGTIHVLSVSGLHTGLIYLLLSFLFDLFDRKKKYKIGKFVFITVSLWLLALITGFSAPVLRAVIMFNLLGIGNIFFRNTARNQINILLFSAFILLVINPFWIADIGFQLSYFALAGILIFQPVFEKIWKPENKILDYTWQSTSASFAATLTTLPFTLFYFKQFPIWFFLCNLIVVPVSFLILLLAILAVFKFGFAVFLINQLATFMIAFIALFNAPGIGFIDQLDFRLSDAIYLSLFVIFISLAFQKRSYPQMVYALLILIFWQLNGLAESWQSKQMSVFTVYQVNKEDAVSVKNKRETILDSISSSKYDFHVKPHIISFNYPELKTADFNLVSNRGEVILLLSEESNWPVDGLSEINTLVLSNNFRLQEEDLREFISLRKIICDGSNNYYSNSLARKLCDKFGLEFYSTRERGAYIKEL